MNWQLRVSRFQPRCLNRLLQINLWRSVEKPNFRALTYPMKSYHDVIRVTLRLGLRNLSRLCHQTLFTFGSQVFAELRRGPDILNLPRTFQVMWLESMSVRVYKHIPRMSAISMWRCCCLFFILSECSDAMLSSSLKSFYENTPPLESRLWLLRLFGMGEGWWHTTTEVLNKESFRLKVLRWTSFPE